MKKPGKPAGKSARDERNGNALATEAVKAERLVATMKHRVETAKADLKHAKKTLKQAKKASKKARKLHRRLLARLKKQPPQGSGKPKPAKHRGTPANALRAKPTGIPVSVE